MPTGERAARLVWPAPARTPLVRPEESFVSRVVANFSNWFRLGPPLPRENALVEALHAVGVPTLAPPADPSNPMAWAAAFLDTGAELEHALMIEYLYAAYSAADPAVTQTIARIAAHEMGHLATVQNLRLLLGLDPYLGRQDQAPQPGQDPFPFKREPLTIDSLAKYASAERPDEIPDHLRAVTAEIMQRAAQVTGEEVPRVGLIYAFLYWIFLPTDQTATRPWPNFPEAEFGQTGVPQLSTLPGGADTFQAEPVEWRAGSRGLHVDVCTDGRSALEAIHRIAAQGEGLASVQNSHFLDFVDLYQRMRDGGLAVHMVPVDPHTGGGPPESLVSHPVSRAICGVLDAAYAALQIQILICFRIDRSGTKAGLRRSLITHLLSEVMQGVIGPLARLLAEHLPRQETQPPGDQGRSGAIFSPPAVTGGTLAELIAAWRLAIDAFQSALDQALEQPDPEGRLGGLLANVQEVIDTERQLLLRLAA